MTAAAFLAALTWLVGIGLGCAITASTCRLLEAVAEHRRAQASSIMKHAGLLTSWDEDDDPATID